MDLIAFRCSSCDQALKIPAEKAGRKIKCTRCGTELTVPSQEPAPPPPKEDQDRGGYGLVADPAEEAAQQKEKEKPKKKEEKKKAPKVKRRLKSIQDPEQWAKVRAGLAVVLIVIYLWAGAFGLQVLVVLLGRIMGTEYGAVAEKILTIENQTPAPGDTESVNLPGFLVALVASQDLYVVGRVLLIIASLRALGQAGVALAGYGQCLAIPDRFGTRGQVKTLIILALVNVLFNLVFKLLPLTGVMNYALIPWFTPEVCMIDANTDRALPLHVFWSKSGFWEMLLSILVMFSYYAEPVMLGVLIWSIGTFLREPPVEEVGSGVVQISFGVAFTMLVYLLFSITGTSAVLLLLLKICYGLWILFTTILLVRFVMAINKTRETIAKYLEAAEESPGAQARDEDEGEEDEIEERPRRPRKKKRPYEED
jgi:hypothetical protein